MTRERAPVVRDAEQKTAPRRTTARSRLEVEGIRRTGTPARGFRYARADGGKVGARDRARIEDLAIPPAWRDVLISPADRASIQAMGRDAAGRWQYLYHASQTVRRERAKSRRLVRFIEALPRMRKAVARDMRRRELPREKVLACILKVLSTCFLRPGSEIYASENKSYGIATLRRRHVRVKGDVVEFDFEGKSGKRQHREVRDPAVARVVRKLVKLPGVEVFKFEDEEQGRVVDVRRRHINDYIKQVMGQPFSAKDFRTWAGTLLCACALASAGIDPDESRRARNKKLVAAVRATAEQLGNTPAICRSSYIHSLVLKGFEHGHVLGCSGLAREDLVAMQRGTLQRAERELVAFLTRGNARGQRARAARTHSSALG